MAQGTRTTVAPTTATKIGRLLTAPLRVRPDFLLIGAMRCGTTSLFEYICQHPSVVQSLYKEIRYFSDRYRLGSMLYRACFPTRAQMQQRRKETGLAMTFDASPGYMFSPLALQRIRKDLGRVKLVAILRDPVQRAISHYKLMARRNLDPLRFDEAIAAEDQRTARRPGESDDHYYHRRQDVRRFSYAARGMYGPQLEKVIDIFGRENLHVLCLETLVEQRNEHFAPLLGFLGLPAFDGVQFDRYHTTAAHAHPDVSPDTLKKLRDKFAPSNARVRELFGDIFPWAHD